MCGCIATASYRDQRERNAGEGDRRLLGVIIRYIGYDEDDMGLLKVL